MTNPDRDAALDPASAPDSYRTGEPEMDGEHLRLFTALQRLDESLRGPHGLETLGARLRQLEDMLVEHYRNEEDLMERVQYPHLELHRTEHEMMTEHCRGLLETFIGPDSPPLEDLAGRLMELMRHHIQTVDRDYAAYLEREGFTAGPLGGS
jgi:methyl-accepting chemotaxis protein